MKRKIILCLTGLIVIGVGLMAYTLFNKPYEIMAGSMSIDIGDGAKCLVNPCKVRVKPLAVNKPIAFPLTITNNSDKKAVFAITYRIPDFVAEGYETHIFGCGIDIASDYPDLMNVEVEPKSSTNVNIVVEKTMQADLPKYEAWLDVKETSDKSMITVGLCIRILFDN